ncbi:MAG: DUF1553 domain-containing protein, partial [Verrucomicrobiota bacterium]
FIYVKPGGVVKHPVTQALMAPHPPGGPEIKAEGDMDPRHGLVDWMLKPENPFFARTAVNRIWSEFFGRGIVHPVDDFRASNPPVNEPLLDALAEDFVRHGYDLKHLMRRILTSRAYRTSSLPNEVNITDTTHFSRSYRRRLPAEVLLDAVCDVTEVPETFEGLPPGSRAVQTWNLKMPSTFLDTFGRPDSSAECPCDRVETPTMTQALHLMNAERVGQKISSKTGRAHRLAGSEATVEEVAEELYLATFARLPTSDELKTVRAYFEQEGRTRVQAVEDVLWALLNSAEFVFNH